MHILGADEDHNTHPDDLNDVPNLNRLAPEVNTRIDVVIFTSLTILTGRPSCETPSESRLPVVYLEMALL